MTRGILALVDTFEEALQVVALLRPLYSPRESDRKWVTKAWLCERTIIHRPPSAFTCPAETMGRVLRDLARAGYVERRGAKYTLVHGAPPDFPAQTYRGLVRREGFGLMDGDVPFRALYETDEATSTNDQAVIVTNLWNARGGRVYLFAHAPSGPAPMFWTSYITAATKPLANDLNHARAVRAGYVIKASKSGDGFCVGTNDVTRLAGLAKFFSDVTYQRLSR